jgi:hypothetical protein
MSSSEYDSESEYSNSDSEYEDRRLVDYDSIIDRAQINFRSQTKINSYRNVHLIRTMHKQTINLNKYNYNSDDCFKYTDLICDKHNDRELPYATKKYLFVYTFKHENYNYRNYCICSYCLLGLLPQMEAYISNRNTRIQNREIIIGQQYDENSFELKDKIDLINNAVKKNECEVSYNSAQSTCSCCKNTCHFYSVIKDNTSDTDITLCPECVYRFSNIHFKFISEKSNNANIKLLWNTGMKKCDVCSINEDAKRQWFYSAPIPHDSYDVCSDCMMDILPALTKNIDNMAPEIHISKGKLTQFTAKSFPLYANMRQISYALYCCFGKPITCEISDVKCSSCQEPCCIMHTISAEDLELDHDIKLCAVCLHKLIPLHIAENQKIDAEETAQIEAEQAAAEQAAEKKAAAKSASRKKAASPVGQESAQTI